MHSVSIVHLLKYDTILPIISDSRQGECKDVLNKWVIIVFVAGPDSE